MLPLHAGNPTTHASSPYGCYLPVLTRFEGKRCIGATLGDNELDDNGESYSETLVAEGLGQTGLYMKTKSEMRAHVLGLLKSMDKESRSNEQAELDVQMEKLLNSGAVNVSFYLSQVWEVSTLKAIQFAWKQGVKVSCPRVLSKGVMSHYLINSLEQCEMSKWGVLEPKPSLCAEIQPENFDMIFVPGLAFTENGWRLGYGGGFYDRFLQKVKGDKIGLSFKNQLFSQLPVENHDVQLDRVLMPKLSSKPSSTSIAQNP